MGLSVSHRRYRIWLGAVLCHLFLVMLGAGNVDLERLGIFGQAIAFYGAVSGSAESYGFFAPGVSSQLEVLFDLTDRSGKTRTISLETGASHEADLRVGNVIGQFSNESEEPEKLQRSVAASLAGTVFGRYPEAKEVNVRLEEFTPVSMADYRVGKRPQWAPIYQAKFVVAAK